MAVESRNEHRVKSFIIVFGVICLIAFDVYVLRRARKPTDRPPPLEEVQVYEPESTIAAIPATSLPAAEPLPSPTPRGATNNLPIEKPDKAKSSILDKGWPQADVIPGEFVLSFYDNNDRAIFVELAKLRGGEILGLMDLGHSVRIRCKDKEWLEALLKESPTSVDASPNFYARVPEKFSKVPETAESTYKTFGASSLRWLGVSGDCSSWGKGVTVAVLDTGVESSPVLAESNISRLSKLSSSTGEGEFRGHATAVASLLAGTTSDLPGVAPACKILSVQVLSADGSGDTFTLAQGIVEAVDCGARIVNLSLGTHSDCFLLEQAVEYAQQKGAIVVAAVGNDGLEGVVYPARYNGVVAVTAVDAAGKHLFFANHGSEVALAAPGLGVTAAAPKEGSVSFSGTSAAVPFVSGALAALLSQNPQMTLGEAVEVLCKYSNDAGAPGKDSETGNGILNVGWALNRNVSGIYDVTMCSPYLHPRQSKDEDMIITTYVQNRGTENLRHVQMKVSIDDVEQTLDFYDIAVGKSVGHDFRIDPEQMRRPVGVSVICAATIDGADDINPSDNINRTTLYLRPEQKSKTDSAAAAQ